MLLSNTIEMLPSPSMVKSSGPSWPCGPSIADARLPSVFQRAFFRRLSALCHKARKPGVIFLQRVRHRLRFPLEQQIRQITRRFPTVKHRPYTADAGHNNVFAGELLCPCLYSLCDLLIGNMAIQVIAAANGIFPAEICFFDGNVHFPQEAPDSTVYLRLMPITAGIMYGNR